MIIGFVSGGYIVYKDTMYYVLPNSTLLITIPTSINAHALTLLKEKKEKKVIETLCVSINEWRHTWNPLIKHNRNVLPPVKILQIIMPITSIKNQWLNIEEQDKIIMETTKYCDSYYEKNYKANK